MYLFSLYDFLPCNEWLTQDDLDFMFLPVKPEGRSGWSSSSPFSNWSSSLSFTVFSDCISLSSSVTGVSSSSSSTFFVFFSAVIRIVCCYLMKKIDFVLHLHESITRSIDCLDKLSFFLLFLWSNFFRFGLWWFLGLLFRLGLFGCFASCWHFPRTFFFQSVRVFRQTCCWNKGNPTFHCFQLPSLNLRRMNAIQCKFSK